MRDFRYIDFHVHAFAEKIAARTMAALSATAGTPPLTDGTLAGAQALLDECGVDGFVLLTIATKPTQHEVCNNWAAAQKCDHIFPFGSVHPEGDALAELERIKALGLYGIKLHPDYQGFHVDEPRMFPIYRKCAELGLPVLLHAGVDPLSPDHVHSTPEMAIRAMEACPDTTFILAHLGGNEMWDEVEERLAGQYPQLYMDTALVGSYVDEAQLARIIRKHGPGRFLLASDCPWDRTDLTIRKLSHIGLTPEELHAVCAGNAMRLLGLPEKA